MNKKIISIVIVLISISIIGIIAVQYLWIKNAVNVKEEQFDRAVNDALNSVAGKLDTRESAFFLTERLKKLIPDTFENKTANIQEHKVANEKKVYNNSYAPESSDSNDFIRIEICSEDSLFKKNFNLAKEIIINQCDTNYPSSFVIKKGYTIETKAGDKTSHPVNRNIDNTGKGYTIVTKNVINVKTKTDKSTDKLSKVLYQLAWEFERCNDSIEKRLKKSTVDSVIRTELKNKGINLGYDYGIVSGNNNVLSSLCSKGFRKDYLNSKYKVNLMQNNIYAKPDILIVNFQDKNKYIYKSLSFMFLGSLFFTLIILFTFIATVSVILRQKKISEIKNDFINNMTHEFKTPIATISLTADTIASPVVMESESQVKYFIGIIKEEAKRMNKQVEKILQMSLLDKKDYNLKIQPLNANELIEKAVDNIRMQIGKREGTIITDLSAENAVVMADAVHFTNVIFNLLDNANKYSPVKPDIRVSTKNIQDKILISVEDKGIGMSKEHQNKIFEKFYRVPTGNIHNVKGFGLGLSYVKEIVNAMKGTIRVKSELNKGSTFELLYTVYKTDEV